MVNTGGMVSAVTRGCNLATRTSTGFISGHALGSQMGLPNCVLCVFVLRVCMCVWSCDGGIVY